MAASASLVRHSQATMATDPLDDYCFPGVMHAGVVCKQKFGLSSAGTPRAHHELDGWVHTEAHDAFDLAQRSRQKVNPIGLSEGSCNQGARMDPAILIALMMRRPRAPQ